MKEMPQISDSEWKVMNVLWTESPVTANQVMDKVAMDWKPTTVKTLLSRLVKKEAVGFKENNRTYLYYPLINEEEYVKAESKTFLKKVYGGGLKAMLINFLEIERLSDEEINELKRILDKKSD